LRRLHDLASSTLNPAYWLAGLGSGRFVVVKKEMVSGLNKIVGIVESMPDLINNIITRKLCRTSGKPLASGWRWKRRSLV
jgi:hypothetical protein